MFKERCSIVLGMIGKIYTYLVTEYVVLYFYQFYNSAKKTYEEPWIKFLRYFNQKQQSYHVFKKVKI